MSRQRRGDVRELQDLGYGIHVVPLTRGMFALIDSCFAEEVGAYNWHAVRPEGNNHWYAGRGGEVDGKRQRIWLHRVVMRAPVGAQVDHVNLDGLDNTLSNLRLATPTENAQNVACHRDNLSGLKGVTRSLPGLWRARIRVDGRPVHLGYFRDPLLAHAAYAEAARRHFGEFARIA